MVRGFAGLGRVLLRRGSKAASPATVESREAALGGDELGPPPILLPAVIIRDVLYDPNETPAWLRPRQAPFAPKQPPAAEAIVADPPKPAKRSRRPKASPASAPAPTRPRAKREAKP